MAKRHDVALRGGSGGLYAVLTPGDWESRSDADTSGAPITFFTYSRHSPARSQAQIAWELFSGDA